MTNCKGPISALVLECARPIRSLHDGVQECDLRFGLYSSLTCANNLNLHLLTLLLYSILTKRFKYGNDFYQVALGIKTRLSRCG